MLTEKRGPGKEGGARADLLEEDHAPRLAREAKRRERGEDVKRRKNGKSSGPVGECKKVKCKSVHHWKGELR